MLIRNRFVEVGTKADEPSPVTLRFPTTSVELTITFEEARELWAALDCIFGPAPEMAERRIAPK